MFFKIFSFEIKYWVKNPLFYIYVGSLFAIATLAMASSAGLFDSVTVTRSSIAYINSAFSLNNFINGFTIIGFFLIPSIVGGTIAKDYTTNTSNVLYSFPFTKSSYLFAKYLSGLVITILVLLSVALGAMVGGYLPGTNPELSGPFNLFNYIQPYLIYVIPNLIFFSAIVFGVVTFSRNVASGFVAILALFLLQGVAETIIGNMDDKELGALLDPFGAGASSYYTEYWTVAEQNENFLPFEGYIIYNRLIWGGLGLLVYFGVFSVFKFSHNPLAFSFKKKAGVRSTKNNFGSMVRINLPKVTFDYSFINRIKTAWTLSNSDFLFVVKSWPFIIISLIGLLILTTTLAVGQQIWGTTTYPVTWQMLDIAGNVFTTLAILPITYLYSGMLIHRHRLSKIDQMVDVTPVPNWTMLFSKFLALLKVQAVLLLLIMIAGMLIQTYAGFYDFEINLYLKDLYFIRIWSIVVWSLLAIFIHTLIPNYLIGFFVTLGLAIGIGFLDSIGIEQSIFKYNQGPGTSYSPMNGYGSSLRPYLIYKVYWLLLGAALYVFAIAFWKRGVPSSYKNRLKVGFQSFTRPLQVAFFSLLILFLGLGYLIWYENNVENEYTSQKEGELQRVEQEKLYSKYEAMAQPRIVDVKVDLDLMPETRDFKAKGTYVLVNKTEEVIDSVLLNHNSYPSEFAFSAPNKRVLEDTVYNFDFHVLEKPMMPGDSITFTFEVWNEPNTWLRTNSPVRENGTFMNNGIFPTFGYSGQGELTDNEVRKKYDLPEKERMKSPYDTTALGNTYISTSADWIDFETLVSTSSDQIAIAPGYLQREWEEDGRRYFHYKMDSKMLNFYAYQSARYEVLKDQWKDINIEIYYHKGHEYNLGRMVKGVKQALEYYTENFSPYQHKQVRIIEFPRTSGSFAQSFANTIPFSEGIGFIAKVDDDDPEGVDYPFSVTAHEVAHQWWAHQVIGANVQGATLMSESMSEYSSLKVLEKVRGEEQMRSFLKDALDSYLQGRSFERLKEKPLLFNENQQYIHYNKGSLILYALSDYLGDEVFNAAMSRYIDSVAFQEPPYTTSLEYLEFVKEAVPDSLNYLVRDMFETITLYDNEVKDATYRELPDGKYEVKLNALVAKYRADEKGKRMFTDPDGADSLSYQVEGARKPTYSLPLADWVEVGIFTEKEVDGKKQEVPLYLEKRKFDQINNEITVVVDEKPTSVGIDPYNKLIDVVSNDNRMTPTAEETE
ncbi:M1 family aminopeptidase [Ekhidna sp.]|uniref:M1 family aminopeptidase n=1 Tax=Ekhidna sp. TaxID=2608089 RepID=UPI003B5B7CFB